jgi:hypothetical protein
MLRPKFFFLSAALMALTACGGSSGPALDDVTETRRTSTGLSTSTPPDVGSTARALDELGTVAPVEVDPTDPALLATLAAITANESAISSVALVTDASGDRSILNREGIYARVDGSLSLAGLAAQVNNDVLGDFDSAASFLQDDAVGIVGLATPAADIRTNGDATYAGGASGFVITGTNGIDLIKGSSVVDVAFGESNVNVTLNDFEGVSQISGLVVNSPVTEIELRNATIDDGGFSGGTLTLFDANGSVNITGSDSTTLAQGQFFGLDADGSTPDEVGGLILSQGTSGTVFGTFIAD